MASADATGAPGVTAGMPGTSDVAGVPAGLYARVLELLDEQVRSAREWRDQVNAYFFRKSGVPDARGRRIH